MKFELPQLPYDLNGLEPYISGTTLGIHYGKHHKGYITNLNNLISETKFKNTDLETIIKISEGPIFNNAAQAWNHKFYFEGLKPESDNSLAGPFV